MASDVRSRRVITRVVALARIHEIGGKVTTQVTDKSDVRAMWALGDYHRFAKETIWELGPVLVEA